MVLQRNTIAWPRTESVTGQRALLPQALATDHPRLQAFPNYSKIVFQLASNAFSIAT